jgi:hypothetical protein
MRTECIEKPIELQDATALDLLRQRVDSDPQIQAIQERLRKRQREYPETAQTQGLAYRAGREEAKRAALATGVDYMGRYESMCKQLWAD